MWLCLMDCVVGKKQEGRGDCEIFIWPQANARSAGKKIRWRRTAGHPFMPAAAAAHFSLHLSVWRGAAQGGGLDRATTLTSMHCMNHFLGGGVVDLRTEGQNRSDKIRHVGSNSHYHRLHCPVVCLSRKVL